MLSVIKQSRLQVIKWRYIIIIIIIAQYGFLVLKKFQLN